MSRQKLKSDSFHSIVNKKDSTNIPLADEMSTLNSLKKKCRQLEERGRWKDLSEIYNKIATAYRSNREYADALAYYKKDRKLCETHHDPKAEAHGTNISKSNNK